MVLSPGFRDSDELVITLYFSIFSGYAELRKVNSLAVLTDSLQICSAFITRIYKPKPGYIRCDYFFFLWKCAVLPHNFVILL